MTVSFEKSEYFNKFNTILGSINKKRNKEEKIDP